MDEDSYFSVEDFVDTRDSYGECELETDDDA